MHPVEEYQDIITLTVDVLNEGEIVTLAGRRVNLKLLYNPGEDRKSVRWRSDELERRCWIEEHVPGPRLSPGERERNAVMADREGVNMLQFCSVSNSLSHTTLSIKGKIYFSKELYRSSSLRRYVSACICVCIVGHGYTTNVVDIAYIFIIDVKSKF